MFGQSAFAIDYIQEATKTIVSNCSNSCFEISQDPEFKSIKDISNLELLKICTIESQDPFGKCMNEQVISAKSEIETAQTQPGQKRFIVLGKLMKDVCVARTDIAGYEAILNIAKKAKLEKISIGEAIKLKTKEK